MLLSLLSCLDCLEHCGKVGCVDDAAQCACTVPTEVSLTVVHDQLTTDNLANLTVLALHRRFALVKIADDVRRCFEVTCDGRRTCWPDITRGHLILLIACRPGAGKSGEDDVQGQVHKVVDLSLH